MVSGGGGIPSNRKRVNLILSFSHKGTDERKDARVEKQRRASQPSIFTPPGRGAKVQRVRFITLSHSHTLTFMGKVNILNPVL